MRLAAVIITYFPDPTVLSNIGTYLDRVDKLYIIDNSEPAHIFPPGIQNHPKITIIALGINRGIAAPLNEAVALAIAQGYGWLLTMDQDSHFGKDQLDQYLNNIENFQGNEQVAQFGITFEHTTNMARGSFRSSRLLITSGSLMNLKLIGAVGGFNEALFIDEVDHEYCFRSGKAGFDTIQFTDVYLNHNLGTKKSARSLKNFKETERSLHAPIRLYYMYRNFLYVSRYYKSLFPEEINYLKKDLLNRIKNNFLYGGEKGALLKMLLQARSDFKNGRMGKKL
ncbi:MAG: glycosyltransferase [Niabella sp.]|nr:glycosyltransferase [Niabella sp.]